MHIVSNAIQKKREYAQVSSRHQIINYKLITWSNRPHLYNRFETNTARSKILKIIINFNYYIYLEQWIADAIESIESTSKFCFFFYIFCCYMYDDCFEIIFHVQFSIIQFVHRIMNTFYTRIFFDFIINCFFSFKSYTLRIFFVVILIIQKFGTAIFVLGI